MTKVMVFGSFDGLHEGHRALLKEAKEHGDYLIAVVAHDHIIEHLKGRLPERNLAKRFEHLRQEDGVNQVVIGDEKMDTWGVVAEHEPDVIALGYDQSDAMEVALKNFLESTQRQTKVIRLHAFEPEKYKSSILNS